MVCSPTSGQACRQDRDDLNFKIVISVRGGTTYCPGTDTAIDVKNVFYVFYFKIKNAFFNVFYFCNVFY